MVQKTKEEILQETINWYGFNIDRRAVVYDPIGKDYRCVYQSPEGNNCAIGRCMDFSTVFGSLALSKNSLTLHALDRVARDFGSENEQFFFRPNFQNYLLAEYKGHSLAFWLDLQHLHDLDGFWSKDQGLTKDGLEWVDKIRVKIRRGAY